MCRRHLKQPILAIFCNFATPSPPQTYLSPRSLAPHRQAQSVPSASIRAHIPQPGDILPHLALQLILDAQGRELGVEVEDLLGGQIAQLARRMDVEPGHDPLRELGPDAVEVLQGCLCGLFGGEEWFSLCGGGLGKRGGGAGVGVYYPDEASFVKVDAQNEDLADMSIPSHIGGYGSVVFGYHGW